MKSETLSFKTIISQLDFLIKKLLFNETLEKKKDLLLLANKLIEEILDHCNAKEYYQSIIKKKNKKSANETEIIFYQTKAFEHPNIVGIKSIITEFSKSSYELSKNIR